MRAHQISLFLGLACLSSVLPTSPDAQRDLQFPQGSDPPPNVASSWPARRGSRPAQCLGAGLSWGCLGAEAGNIKAGWAVLASAGAAARAGTATSVSRNNGA